MIETLKNVDIDKITPYDKNYQSHDLNREHIKNSIEDFNFDVPIVVDPDYVIVKGHGRYEALKELNHKTVPLVVVNHSLDTKEKAAAARIADNESSRAAQIDNAILKGELLDIGDFFDMSDYGIDLDITEVDYSVLDDENLNEKLDDMASETRKAILIEFKIEDYEQALKVTNELRKKSVYIGGLILNHLIMKSREIKDENN